MDSGELQKDKLFSTVSELLDAFILHFPKNK